MFQTLSIVLTLLICSHHITYSSVLFDDEDDPLDETNPYDIDLDDLFKDDHDNENYMIHVVNGQDEKEEKPDVKSSKFRIGNGQSAVQHEFPTIVSVRFHGNHICGGTLLNANSVLTAAHCVYHMQESRVPVSALVIVTGKHVVENVEGSDILLEASAIVRHKDYDNNAPWRGDDLAIVKLSKPIQQEKYIEFVDLPESDFTSGDCQIVGWGSVNPLGTKLSPVLKKAPIDMMTNDECANVFPDAANNTKVICAGQDDTNGSACRGDSGGPLYCTVPGSKKTVQVGIISSGSQHCAIPGIPGIFTRISHYTEWIKSNM